MGIQIIWYIFMAELLETELMHIYDNCCEALLIVILFWFHIRRPT